MKNKTVYYLAHIFLGFFIAQLLGSSQTSHIIVGLLMLFVHTFIIFNYLKDSFLFILYLFFMCLINSSDKLGGILLAPLVNLLWYYWVPGRLKIKDKLAQLFIIILVTSCFLGYLVKNDSGNFEIFQSIIICLGTILVLIYVMNYEFTREKISLFIKTLTFVSALMLAVSINQKFIIIDSSQVLLGAVSGFHNVSSLSAAFEGRIPSLLGDYELFSEFSLLIFILSFCLLLDRKTISYFDLGNFPFMLMFISFLNLLITGTRSSFLLVFLFIPLYYMFRMKSFFSGRNLILLATIAILIPVFLQYGNLVGFDIIIKRLKEIDLERIGIENIQSGEEMNRSIVYAFGYKRLEEENWLLGYGLGTANSNGMAWVNGSSEITDFHSLYLCIPMIYGWVGSTAYFAMLLYVLFTVFKRYFMFSASPLNSFFLGFGLLFIFFLINQAKINSLRLYNYQLLIWMMIGIALSLSRVKDCIEDDEDSLVY